MTLTTEVHRPEHLPILAVEAGSEKHVLSVMRSPLGFETHYLGRSVLCGGEECDGCKHRCSRWLGYLGVNVAGRAWMLELTAAAWQAAYGRIKFEKWDDALGIAFSVSKRSLRSPLHLEPIGLHPRTQDERATARVLRTVARLYRLPLPRPEEAPSEWNDRVTDARRGIVRAAVLSEIGLRTPEARA